MDKLLFALNVIVVTFAASIIAGVVWFGARVFCDRHFSFEHFLEFWVHGPRPAKFDEVAQVFADTVSNYREQRNEFWTTYGQIILSIFIVAVLTVLLLTRTISAESGLPILSGISGFAIAKTVNATPGGRPPPPPAGQEREQ
jgi:hypothetical protein